MEQLNDHKILSKLSEVKASLLLKTVKQRIGRSPENFLSITPKQIFGNLKSQFVTSKPASPYYTNKYKIHPARSLKLAIPFAD